MYQRTAFCRGFWGAVAIAAACAQTACGGSSSDASQAERINGLVVPPAPDPAENASTLGGVDIDRNGVRDDIDRQLATTFGGDAARYAIAARVNQTLQAALMSPTPAKVESHVREVSCIRERTLLQESSRVTRATLDTPERARVYALAFAGAGATLGNCP